MVHVEAITYILSVLTVIGNIVILMFLINIISKKTFDGVFRFFKKNAFVLAFIVALIATFGSLYYSEIVGYEPCKLCWFQRIFMYPFVVMFAVSLWKKDRNVFRYVIPMAIIGGLIALYHYYLQISKTTSVACSVVGYSVSCSEHFFLRFGYITIPTMALTAFILIIIAGILVKRES